jgi:hypothetical protein
MLQDQNRVLPKTGLDQEQLTFSLAAKFHFGLRFQPVDATHWLNRSAGVSKSNVFLGRALSRYFFELKGVPNTTKFGLGC